MIIKWLLYLRNLNDRLLIIRHHPDGWVLVDAVHGDVYERRVGMGTLACAVHGLHLQVVGGVAYQVLGGVHYAGIRVQQEYSWKKFCNHEYEIHYNIVVQFDPFYVILVICINVCLRQRIIYIV